MSFHRVGLANTESQCQPIIQTRVSQIEVAAPIQSIHQRLIHLIPAFAAKAHQVERDRRCQFETIIVPDPVRELLRQFNVPPNVILQALHAIMTDHEPKFQGAKAAAERNLRGDRS